MIDRIDAQTFYKAAPVIRQSLRALSEAAVASGLEKSMLELVKLRASQINGCAFCVAMHSREAREMGERQERLDLVAVWREAPCFTPREEAALEWTEALTLIAEDHVPDAVYAAVKRQFSDSELVNLTGAIVAINGWNRIAGTFRWVPQGMEPRTAQGGAS
jgi:AhpD family alkylhydroperoxidase